MLFRGYAGPGLVAGGTMGFLWEPPPGPGSAGALNRGAFGVRNTHRSTWEFGLGPRPLVRADGLGRLLLKGGDPAAPSGTATLLRLRPSHQTRPRRLPPLRVSSATSIVLGFHDVTGGVYKARERIHRSMLTCGY